MIVYNKNCYFQTLSSGSSWLKACPWGLRKNLVWIKQEYGDLDVYITENGVSDKSGTLDDPDRVSYYNTYINNVLKGNALLSQRFNELSS